MSAVMNEAGQSANHASIEGMRSNQLMPREQQYSIVEPGFGTLASFELLHRQAKALSSSTLVPVAYQQVVTKRNYKGEITSSYANENAIPNTMIALNMATRMRADPVMVMQNLVVVEGRPTWSSQWVIAQINNCGRFEPLRFDVKELGSKKVTYEYTEWVSNERQRKTNDVQVDNIECTAWTVPKGVAIPHGVQTIEDAKKAGLPILKGPKVSVEIAVKEGWFTKTGSKWQTMPELMLHYRSGAFFGRLYAPELLMGIPSQEEAEDIAGVLVPQADGSYAPTVDSLRRGPEPVASPAASPAAAPAAEQATAQTGPASDAAAGAGDAGAAATGKVEFLKFADVADAIAKAQSAESVELARGLVPRVEDAAQQAELNAKIEKRLTEFSASTPSAGATKPVSRRAGAAKPSVE